jgi:hypothetical protein
MDVLRGQSQNPQHRSEPFRQHRDITMMQLLANRLEEDLNMYRSPQQQEILPVDQPLL